LIEPFFLRTYTNLENLSLLERLIPAVHGERDGIGGHLHLRARRLVDDLHRVYTAALTHIHTVAVSYAYLKRNVLLKIKMFQHCVLIEIYKIKTCWPHFSTNLFLLIF